jgi:hypothetical protein
MSPEYWLQLASSEYWLQFARDHWLQIAPYFALFLLTIIPSIWLLHRAGIHIALAAINLIPIGGTIVLLWVIAFSKWPKLQVIAPDRAVEGKVKERLSGKPMPDPEPAPMTDEMIKQIAERFGANARPEDTATLDAKQLRHCGRWGYVASNITAVALAESLCRTLHRNTSARVLGSCSDLPRAAFTTDTVFILNLIA